VILLFFDKIFFLSVLSLPFGLMYLKFRVKILCIFVPCVLRVVLIQCLDFELLMAMVMMMMVVVIISCFTFVVSLYKSPCVLVPAVF